MYSIYSTRIPNAYLPFSCMCFEGIIITRHGIILHVPITFTIFCYDSRYKSNSSHFYLHCSLPTTYWPVTND